MRSRWSKGKLASLARLSQRFNSIPHAQTAWRHNKAPNGILSARPPFSTMPLTTTHTAMHDPLTAFEQRWLAEATRLREEVTGPADDTMAVRRARATGGDLEHRILARAATLGERSGLMSAIHSRRQHIRLIALIAMTIAIMGGAGAASAVLGDGTHPVNVIWAISGLLGFHAITLLLWLIGRWLPLGASGSLAGQLWLQLQARLGAGPALTSVLQAHSSIAQQTGASYWWLGRVSHALWLATLSAALLTLVFLLATRRYGFVWETTILPADVFVQLTQILGALPAALGITMPDATMVLNAGETSGIDADRHAWSAWLVASVLLYGALPRAAALVICQFRWHRAQRAFRLDLDLPAYATLQARLMPNVEHSGISSAAPARLPSFHAAHHTTGAGDGRCLMALELADDLAWPPTGFSRAFDAGRIDSRDARHQALDHLAQHSAERLLLAIDARLSPDRGALALIAELSRYADDTAVWFYGQPADTTRMAHWRDGLQQIGLADDHIVDSADLARAWVEANHG
ncbi:DUF2868 domain-containing protein [Denitromonas halophila]|uniref:DUF2868 domain-containing protein n=1 Tax=Denitromonas halophila TaxID=1629404 RepID=A0A557QH56_9RHOO|nr:DUF2868 domain-containing protein [Denitromonas halophila]